MKKRLTEFLTYLEVGQNKFEEKVGLSRGFVNKLSENITVKSLDKIKAAYPELNADWLVYGEGDMLKPGSVVQRGKNNVNVSGTASGITGVMTGGTIVHNGSKDQVIEEQKAEVNKMFEAVIVAVNGFQKTNERHDEHVLRQDDYIRKQDEYIDRIINNSYMRNKENMERFDLLLEQINKLILMVVEQNQRTQDRADRLFDMLEKKL